MCCVCEGQRTACGRSPLLDEYEFSVVEAMLKGEDFEHGDKCLSYHDSYM